MELTLAIGDLKEYVLEKVSRGMCKEHAPRLFVIMALLKMFVFQSVNRVFYRWQCEYN